MRRREVHVVGAGVIGLTTGISLLEAGHAVTIRAAEIPGRTSLTAAAMWGRYLVGPAVKVERWSEQTRQVLVEEANRPGTGVRMLTGVEVDGQTRSRQTIPVLDMPSYMDFLVDRFQNQGGRIEQATVSRLDELGEIVVNCSGIGARTLLGDDSLTPVRGQLVLLSNPGITEYYVADTVGATDFTHFLPHGEIVIAGGIAHAHDDNLEPDPGIAAAIIARCARVEPKLAYADVLGHRVALRPSRPEVRLEKELIGGTNVIHNYGHGGAGISLSWGCASDVTHLIP